MVPIREEFGVRDPGPTRKNSKIGGRVLGGRLKTPPFLNFLKTLLSTSNQYCTSLDWSDIITEESEATSESVSV